MSTDLLTAPDVQIESGVISPENCLSWTEFNESIGVRPVNRHRRDRMRRQRSRRAKRQLRCPFTGRFEKPLPTGVSIDDRLCRTAIHEAAHAVICSLIGPDRLRGITIVPNERALGQVFTKRRRVGRTNKTLLRSAWRKRIMFSLAGPIADFANGGKPNFFGDVLYIAQSLAKLRGEEDCPIQIGLCMEFVNGAQNDIARYLSQTRVSSAGDSCEMRADTFLKLTNIAILGCAANDVQWTRIVDMQFPNGLRGDDHERLDSLIELSRETFQLLKQHWHTVLSLASTLLRKQRMSAREVSEVTGQQVAGTIHP